MGAREDGMVTVIGLDGYRGGWVAVYLENSRQRFDYGALDRLLDVPYKRAMIDIPVGLPARGYRGCDVAAKAMVGSSAFLGARWNLWKFKAYEHANAHYWNDNDTGISVQLWNLTDKLREINVAMTPALQRRLQESHPELVFWRLNGGQMLPSKKTPEGRWRRIELLKEQGIERIEEWLGQRRGTGIGHDDLIDACACAIAARDRHESHRLPIGVPVTKQGIRMEIWY
jgi:predicted RNase H-like nuclease